MLSIATVGGFQAYEYANITTAEILMMENVEALTNSGEPGSTIVIGSSMANGSKTYHTVGGNSNECHFTETEPDDCAELGHWVTEQFNCCEETNNKEDKCDTSEEINCD